jgi:hypothetical protein
MLVSASGASAQVASASASPEATASGTRAAAPTASPTSAPGPVAGPIVTGSGEALCPWGDELPAGADVPSGGDDTSNARDFVFQEAPMELDIAGRLRASWSSFTRGAMGAISPGCTVYLFDDASIDPIWDWYVQTFADRSAPSPTEEPAPAGAPGEDGRLFVYPPIAERDSWTYVFRLGNVIASISLDAEPGSGMTADDLVPIAQAVARRIEAAAAGEPMPAAPSPTPEPSFPSSEEAALIEHVPVSFRETCGRSTFGRSDQALAAVECLVEIGSGSVTVTFQQLPDQAAMTELYENTLSFLGVTADTGPCGGEWPAEGTYTIGGEPGGRVGCALLGELAAIISWTDERFLIHGYAEGFGVEGQQLYDWWLEDSGPVGAPAAATTSPAPGSSSGA